MKWNTIKPGVITVCTYSGFAPICFVKDNKPAGKDISFLKTFAADKGMKAEFIMLDSFEGIWEKPGDKLCGALCDIAAAGISPWQTRKDASPGVVWSWDYFHVQRSLLIRKADADKFQTIVDFKDKTIAVTKHSSADLDITGKTRKDLNINVVYRSDQGVAVAELLAGSIDAFGEGDVSNQYLAEGKPLTLTALHELDKANPEAFSFPVREKSGILDALDDWIKQRPKNEYLNIQV